MLKRYPFIRRVVILSLLLFNVGCGKEEKPVEVDTSRKINQISKKEDKPALIFAVSSINSPEKIYKEYAPFIHFLGKKMKVEVKLVMRKSSEEIYDLFKAGSADFARLSAGTYVKMKRTVNLDILAIESDKGSSGYQAYIIVHKDSPIMSFDELRGKSFACVDRLSNSGFRYPAYLAAQRDTKVHEYFSHIIYTGGHDKSIMAVFRKEASGASVASYVFVDESHKNPELKNNIRIIQESPLFTRGPIVANKDLTPKVKEQLKKILLNMHLDEEGRTVLKCMKLERFNERKNSDYNLDSEMLKVADE
jgi:phosphonate transport system substrate-binding protein